jgi:tetratricopeptide (TPR) repeat protein
MATSSTCSLSDIRHHRNRHQVTVVSSTCGVDRSTSWYDVRTVARRDSREREAQLACEGHERAERALRQGRAVDAVREGKRALARFVRVDGPASGDVANALLVIAAAQQALGQLAAAQAAAARAWKIVGPARSKDPAVRRLRANALARRGAIEIARGAYAVAVRWARRALRLAERLETDDVISAAMLLGVACKHAGRFDEAARAYARVDALAGDRASEVRAALLHNLGGLAHARGRFAQGERLARRGLAMREALLGGQHLAVAEDLAALAPLLDARGRDREAASAFRRALRLLVRWLGPGHAEVGLLTANLAALEHRRGRHRQAERGYREALRILRQRLGAAHPQLALTMHNFALLQLARGRRAAALRLATTAQALASAALGSLHPEARGLRASVRAIDLTPRQRAARRQGGQRSIGGAGRIPPA